MLRIIWDHYMHGGNYRKLGINDGLCKLCQQPDSVRHWISECNHTTAAALRDASAVSVENHIATLTENDPQSSALCQDIGNVYDTACRRTHAQGGNDTT